MEKLLTPKELATALGVKLETIYAWTHYSKIPYVKAGHLVRFRESEVEQWLKKDASATTGTEEGKAIPTRRSGRKKAGRNGMVDDIVDRAVESTLAPTHE